MDDLRKPRTITNLVRSFGDDLPKSDLIWRVHLREYIITFLDKPEYLRRYRTFKTTNFTYLRARKEFEELYPEWKFVGIVGMRSDPNSPTILLSDKFFKRENHPDIRKNYNQIK